MTNEEKFYFWMDGYFFNVVYIRVMIGALVAGGGARERRRGARPPDTAFATVQVWLHEQEDRILCGRRAELRSVSLLPRQRQALVDLSWRIPVPSGTYIVSITSMWLFILPAQYPFSYFLRSIRNFYHSGLSVLFTNTYTILKTYRQKFPWISFNYSLGNPQSTHCAV